MPWRVGRVCLGGRRPWVHALEGVCLGGRMPGGRMPGGRMPGGRMPGGRMDEGAWLTCRLRHTGIESCDIYVSRNHMIDT